MKLEYLYNNNNNLKHEIKIVSIFGFLCIVECTLIYYFGFMKTLDIFLLLFSMVAIIIPIVIIIFFIIIAELLHNSYNRKQFINIKNNGILLHGTIIFASISSRHIGTGANWLIKDSGYITVEAKNELYNIEHIDYNKEFKILQNELQNNSNNVKDQLDILHNDIHKLIENNNLKSIKINENKITIDIYVLNKKAVADLESICTEKIVW